jgi:methylated-DNA-protein-cysteine methyltransferase-like protein
MSAADDRFFRRVYAQVREIPRGRVATYGQVAAFLGVPRGARAVGWALRALSAVAETSVPWHRVVGAGGGISPRAGLGPRVQRGLLEAEGVAFRGGRVDLARHGILAPSRRQGRGYSMATRGRRRVSRAR